NAAEDAQRRQEIEVRNETDALVYSVQRSLAEHGAKLDAGERVMVEQAMSEAREALQGQDIERIRRAHDGLNRAAQTLAQAISSARTGSWRGNITLTFNRRPSAARPPSGSRRSTRPTRS